MNLMKKFFSCLLAFALLLTVYGGACIPAEAAAQNTPILRIHGEDKLYWVAEDGTQYQLFEDGEYIQAILDDALPYAFKGVLTGNWDEWCERAFNQLKPAFEHFKPDAEGNVPADTYAVGNITADDVVYKDTYTVSESYVFWPDMRVSPMDEADRIHEIAERIRELTGHRKLIFVGQCAGNPYLMAYLHKYEEPDDYAGVESVLISTTTSNGLPNDDAFFSGNIEINGYGSILALKKSDFTPEVNEFAGGLLLQLIYDSLDLVYQSKPTQALTLAVVRNVYNKVKDKFIARVLCEYYGRCGGYVTEVTDHYEEYKDYVFAEPGAKETYAVQIAKFDDYYYNVQRRQPEMILDMRERGVNVSVIAEYGFRNKYFLAGDTALETSDTRLPLGRASFDGTAANFGETLPDSYLQERLDQGLGEYISADRQIDASTCLLPDNTWFIRNAPHTFDLEPGIMSLATAIVRTPGASVQTLEQAGFPRFANLVPGAAALEPLQEVNDNDQPSDLPETSNGFTAFIRWMKSLFRLLVAILKTQTAGSDG